MRVSRRAGEAEQGGARSNMLAGFIGGPLGEVLLKALSLGA